MATFHPTFGHTCLDVRRPKATTTTAAAAATTTAKATALCTLNL